MSELIAMKGLTVTTLDEIATTCEQAYDPRECGGPVWNGCKSSLNDVSLCYTFSCPLAHELDDEDEQWLPEMEGCEYMLQHSKFTPAH